MTINNEDKLNQFDTFEAENKNFGEWFKHKGFTQEEIDLIAYGDQVALLMPIDLKTKREV